MRVYLYEHLLLQDEPPQLGLHAETDYDRKLLEQLEEKYQLTGMGRHGETMQMLHVEIELQPKAGETR